jgi:hypothetical protein
MEQQLFSDPLDQYPSSSLNHLEALRTQTNSGNGFRKNYGLKLYKKLERRRDLLFCAYCHFSPKDLSNEDGFKHWLLMSVDHVIPVSVAKNLVEDKIWDSVLNLVFCCRVCNDFNQGLKGSEKKALEILPPYQPELVTSQEGFLNLRKATFPNRLKYITDERTKALNIYRSDWLL